MQRSETHSNATTQATTSTRPHRRNDQEPCMHPRRPSVPFSSCRRSGSRDSYRERPAGRQVSKLYDMRVPPTTYLVQRSLAPLALRPQAREADLVVRRRHNLFLVELAQPGPAVVAHCTVCRHGVISKCDTSSNNASAHSSHCCWALGASCSPNM